jgi:hypothetical protein
MFMDKMRVSFHAKGYFPPAGIVEEEGGGQKI